jgi:hypothetical protein
MTPTTKSPDVSAAACRARLQQKRPVEDRLVDAGRKTQDAGSAVFWTAVCVLFLLFVAVPLLLAAL